MKQDRLREYDAAKTAEAVRQLKQQILCHLIFINSGEQITPQLPSNRNQKRHLIGLGSHYGVRTCTKILGPRTTHSRFPPKKIQLDLRLWLIRESRSTATLDLRQGISDGSRPQRWGFTRECNVAASSPLWAHNKCYVRLAAIHRRISQGSENAKISTDATQNFLWIRQHTAALEL